MSIELFISWLFIVAFGVVFLSLMTRRLTRDFQVLLSNTNKELRQCRMALEKMADTAQEESVANAKLRKPVEPDDDLLSDNT